LRQPTEITLGAVDLDLGEVAVLREEEYAAP
jgi:hypothetical protein